MASVPFQSTAMASLEGREMWLSLSFSALSNPRFKKALYHEACGPCNCKVPVDSYQLRMRWSALIEFLFSFSNSIAVSQLPLRCFSTKLISISKEPDQENFHLVVFKCLMSDREGNARESLLSSFCSLKFVELKVTRPSALTL